LSEGRSAIRLHGAASVVDSLAKPHAAAVEKATGLKLVIDRSNAGKGLRDLIEGLCDIALASASLETTIDAARAAGLAVAVPGLRMHVIATSEVVFIVHPSNPVRKLSWEQIRDIHTGKIARWKEVGGPDAAIAVVTDAAASATRGLIKQVVLGGSEYAAGARAVAAVAEVNEEVAKNPAAIGGLGREYADAKRVAIVQTKKVERPLAFVTVGEPSEMEARVIEAYRAQAGGGSKAR
jgi:phosphate transport system substrate-binding protein